MKNKILLLGIAGLAMVAMFSCDQKKETVVKEETVAIDADKIKSDIQTMENALADALNSGDADGVSAYYAEDAVSHPQEAAPLVGIAAIKADTEQQIKSSPKGTKLSFTANEIHPSSDGDQVVEIGAYKVMDSTGTVRFTGNYMALFKKIDGKYICVRDMAASDKPRKEEKK